MKKNIKFYIYKVATPILSHNISKKGEDIEYIKDYFNYNILLYCIKVKEVKPRLKRIKTFDKSKTIVLEKFIDNFGEHFAFGEFLTIAHGVKATSIEVEKLTKTKDFNEKEGMLNKVMFFIDKRNGSIYVEHDRNGVLTMKRIQSYFSEMSKRKIYYEKFNEENKPNYQIDTHKRLIDVTTLEPLDFIEQIKDIKKVYDIEIPLNIESYKKESSGVLSSLRKKANEDKIGQHKAKIVLADFNFEKMSEGLLNFIEFLQLSDVYEDLKVKGSLNNNIPRVFTPETRTKDIIFEVEKNINGWTDKKIAFDKLIQIISEDNQLNASSIKGGVKSVSIRECLIDLAREKILKNLKKSRNINYKKQKLVLKRSIREWFYK